MSHQIEEWRWIYVLKSLIEYWWVLRHSQYMLGFCSISGYTIPIVFGISQGIRGYLCSNDRFSGCDLRELKGWGCFVYQPVMFWGDVRDLRFYLIIHVYEFRRMTVTHSETQKVFVSELWEYWTHGDSRRLGTMIPLFILHLMGKFSSILCNTVCNKHI